MPTFVYNPGIQVYIETTDKKTGEKKILDVSDDVISGSLTRVASGVSSFSLQLQNSGRKYDFPHPLFQPNDRVIINMKRVSWVRVLTGYLNQVPVFTIWPGQINLTGACSLKRLQYWTWDPALTASYSLIDNALKQDQNNPDGGITSVFMAVLDQVVGWDKRRVHIGAIPHDWFDFMVPVAQEVEKSAEAAAQASQANSSALGADGHTSGVSNQGPVTSVPVLEGMPIPSTSGICTEFGGWPGHGTPDASTNFGQHPMANGKPPRQAPSYYCAMRWDYPGAPGATSNAKPSSFYYGGGDPAQAKKIVVTSVDTGKQVIVYAADWGPGSGGDPSLKHADTVAIDMDPLALQALGVSSNSKVTIGWASNQNVQPGPITGNEGFNNPQTTSDPQGTYNTAQNPNTVRADGSSAANITGRAFVETAINLVQQNPTLPYREVGDAGSMANLTKTVPSYLDCSSLVMWALLHSVGTLQPGGSNSPLPRVVGDQYTWALNNGAKRIDAATAMKIPGAVMVRLPNIHTEISVGDGQHTVGAHSTAEGCSVVQTSASYWSAGYLMPGVNYLDSTGHIVTGAGSASDLSPNQVFSNGGVGVQQGPQQSLVATDAQGNTKIDKLFGANNSWVALPSDLSGEAYRGANALQNDQRVFPYLDNIIKSSMRQWSSAPNGDIIAWFPDYYGVWGTAAVMYIEDIELMDFQVSWDDAALITHEFVVGALESKLDTTTGSLSSITQDVAIDTRGIATIDLKALVGALFRYKPTDADMQKFRDYIYQRFGARVETQQVPGVYGPKAEFFLAVFNFMQRWSSQFSATVPMTFMPELWPGMLIRLKRYGFQAYVQEVRHDFTVGQGGSFTTSATIVAPSEFGKDPLLSYLPQVTVYEPGTGVQQRNDDFRNVSPQLRRLLTQEGASE